MPDPDPQPPPRLIHPVRWLLMMVPAMLVVAVPPIAETWARAYRPSEQTLGMLIGLTLINSAVAIVLCFVLGFLAEKWRWGSIRNGLRALGFGFLILFMNGTIAFVGCAVTMIR